MLIDLHSHSTASDGADAPSVLVDVAFKGGVRALALTDHDTLAGLDEASQQAEALGMLFYRVSRSRLTRNVVLFTS